MNARLIFCIALALPSLALSTDAENTKDLQEDIRASLIKTKAIMKRFDGEETKQEVLRSSGDVVQIQEREGSRHGSNGRGNSLTGRLGDDSAIADRDPEEERPASQGSGCRMDVGNQPSRGGIRKVTTVVSGNIIQICK
jgi:hypothetical protein